MHVNKFLFFVLLFIVLTSCKQNDKNQNDSKMTVSIIKVQNKILDNTLNNFGTISYKSKKFQMKENGRYSI